MSQVISTISEIISVKARRNIELPIVTEFLQDDNSPATITSFGITAKLMDGLASQSPSEIIIFSTSADSNGNYYIRDNSLAKITCIIGANGSKELQTGKKYFLQIYLTSAGKPVKDAMYEITFSAGAIE